MVTKTYVLYTTCVGFYDGDKDDGNDNDGKDEDGDGDKNGNGGTDGQTDKNTTNVTQKIRGGDKDNNQIIIIIVCVLLALLLAGVVVFIVNKYRNRYTDLKLHCYIASVKVQFSCILIGQKRITCQSAKPHV